MKTAKISSTATAVRLPREFRFQADEVVVKRSSGGVLLLPKKITTEQLYSIQGAFHARCIRAVLVTGNEREFRRVPALAVQNWLKP